MSSDAFTYQPFKNDRHIRALVVHPGQFDDGINCSLHEVPLDSASDFEAISYAWGDISDTRQIFVQGKRATITVSLYTALKQFRRADGDRTLWADALCINQEDNDEKSAQVRMMAEVYRTATRVLVWLGPDTDGMHDFIPAIGRARELIEELGIGFDPEAHRAQGLEELSGEELQQQTFQRIRTLDFNWKPILSIFHRPWFLRKWTIQEVALAREVSVHYGGLSFPYTDLGDVMVGLMNSPGRQHIVAHDQTSLKAFHGAAHTYWLHFSMKKKHKAVVPLSELVMATWQFGCTNPRDHVYSLMGLAADYSPHDTKVLLPDYGCTPAETFTRFAIWNLVEKQNPWVLSLQTAAPMKGLPSWAPNLTSPVEGHNPLAGDEDGLYKAGGTNKPQFTLTDDGKVVQSSGVIVDEVAETVVPVTDVALPPVPAGFERPNIPAYLVQGLRRQQEWLRSCEGLAAAGSGNSTPDGKLTPARFEEFWRTILCGVLVYASHRERADASVGEVFSKHLAYTHSFFEQHEPSWYHENMLSSAILDPTLETYSPVRRFCTTKTGRLALASKFAEPGDKICVLLGTEVPLVLRPVAGSSRYRLVGDCYMQGVMDGEAVNGEAAEFETIRLE
ncbi:hypothetical protein S40288_08652 [Stachybotrys chartarum IBT 40288]|nr:hypothetical protein S40288_08652 [Stachybotrys chartarum IBT 40288]